MDIATEIGGTVSAGEVEIDTADGCTVKGKGTYFGGFGDGEYEVFFCAAMDKKPNECGTWLKRKRSKPASRFRESLDRTTGSEPISRSPRMRVRMC